MVDLENYICLPENLRLVFKPFCKGCRIADICLNDDGFYMDGTLTSYVTCTHLNACASMKRRYENESERVGE